jgi:hypothetical protein
VSRIRGKGPVGSGMRGTLKLHVHKAEDLHQKKEVGDQVCVILVIQ